MTRTTADMSAFVQPGDTVYIAVLRKDGTPTRTGFRATVDDLGRYQGRQNVARGEARVEAIHRPGRGGTR